MKAVILAGGGGTRLWPLSTPEKPKQFQKLVSNRTMLEETLNRVDFLAPKDIFIAINKKHLSLVKKLCPNISKKNIIVEPALRDTAPCIGLAAAIIKHRYPNEVMTVIYADHLIQNKKEFFKKLRLAEKEAKKDFLTIVEVAAKEPNTHYGYVKLGQQIKPDIFELECFTEKPDEKTVKKFIKSGKYLWNTGIYVWKAKNLLEQYKNLKPEMYKILTKIAETGKFSKYSNLEKISIDYAIMEKVDPSKVRIIKADLDWSDIGNWEAVWKELAKSPSENITRGKIKLINCKGCLVYSDTNEELTAIRQKNMIIVVTKNGTLICKKNGLQKKTAEM